MYQLSDLLHDRVQVAKPGAKVLQMHAQHAASARCEHLEVAARLKPLDSAKAVALPRHRPVLGIVARDHEKHARVRAAFVRLAGRVQIPWAEAYCRGNLPAIAYDGAYRLERRSS